MTNTMTVYKKVNNEGSRLTLWEETYRTEDSATVYERLASVMVRKYRWQSPIVKRIEERPEYATGQRVITVYYDFGGVKTKEVYQVAI